MDVRGLGPEHLTALAYWRETQDGLVRVVEEAARTLAATHDLSEELTQRGKPAYGLNYWSTYDLDDPDRWDGWFLDWNIVAGSRGPDHPEPRVYVDAGISAPKRTEFRGEDDAWRRGFDEGLPWRDQVIEFATPWTGNYERLKRVAQIHEVLQGRTLEEQGQSLGRWVRDTYSVILEHGPPFPSR